MATLAITFMDDTEQAIPLRPGSGDTWWVRRRNGVDLLLVKHGPEAVVRSEFPLCNVKHWQVQR